MEKKGWQPVLVLESHALFILPPNAISIRSAASVLRQNAPQSARPRRLSLGGDELSLTMGDGPSNHAWDVLITRSTWGNKFHRKGWQATEQTEDDSWFVIPENKITVRNEHAVENPKLRGEGCLLVDAAVVK